MSLSPHRQDSATCSYLSHWQGHVAAINKFVIAMLHVPAGPNQNCFLWACTVGVCKLLPGMNLLHKLLYMYCCHNSEARKCLQSIHVQNCITAVVYILLLCCDSKALRKCPRKIQNIRPSEIVSGAILWQKSQN